MRSNWISILAGSGFIFGLAFAGGCKGPASTTPEAPPVAKTATAPKIDYGTDVGIPLGPQTANPADLKNLYASIDVQHRADPFSLTPQEKAYDREQASERLVQQGGNMETMYELPEPPDDTPPVEEPQPYRRVSGILVGDSVLAIIEMGEGAPVIVRPGMYVPGTPWFVVSIDEEKVVLRRAGNVQPKEITVRLEQRNPNAAGGGFGGGFGGAGQGGGRPGGGPGAGMGPARGAGAGGGGAGSSD